jgi:hypothetical protein
MHGIEYPQSAVTVGAITRVELSVGVLLTRY